ncbi:MAG TPA: tetratricopeptide repeat protein [Steroidobacteraceae bacterium]
MNPTAGARRAAQTLTDEAVAGIAEAYERGLTLDALKLAETLGPLRNWRGAWPCALASRIATNAGAPRLGMRLGVRAYQSDRGHNEALSQYGLQIMSTRGPLALWNMLRDFRPDCGAASASWELTAEILGLKGRAAADLRDFATAERLLRDAESYNPGRAWVRLQRAYLLERLDRVEEGLEVARAACALHPHPYYRPGVQTCAHLLQLLDRDDDAIALLQQACATLQNAPVAAQLYALLSENRRWAEAEAALERFAHLAPLVEPAGLKWLASERARVAYQRGRRAEAAAFLAGIEDSFYQRFAEKLAEPPPPDERLQLDVTFVRQHFKTCAPATLAAIGQFWKMPADHLKVAEAICYDGTPSWQQRDWAERNGWHVREFRATSESTLALLARRIPFAITVVGATSAHMMAVTGFDRTRGALLLRDPSQPYVIEWKIDDFFERFQAFGPHAMVFVPAAERDRIADLDLPDAALYDEYHRMLLALSKHDRAQAARQLINLARLGKDTALVWEARFDLANYDANTVEQARCLDRVLERFPNTTSRLLQRLECMGEAPREERLRFLERACSVSKADPALFVALARELLGDARRAEECGRWLARARRARPMDSEVIRVQGHLHWQAGRFDEAVEHLRFASCLEGFREHLYRAWFVACRQTRRTQDALDHLEDRYQRFGQKSEQPAVTLAWALIEVDQPQRARKTLQEAIQLRPSDGTLLVRAATLIAGLGEPADATKLLSAAKGVTRENDWLRSRIEVAEKTLDFEAALATGRELLKLEPNALDAHAAIARALARREGMPAARKAIDQACAASPHHCGLRRMRVEWSRRSEPEEMVTAARELLRLEPADAWAHRELAVALSRLNRNDEALREAEEAARIEPSSSYSASTLGLVYRRLGKVSESRRQHRAAITASVDNNYSIGELLELARNDVERRADITFVEQELLRQAVMGDGLLAYLEIARPVLDAEPLLALLRRAHAERPDL